MKQNEAILRSRKAKKAIPFKIALPNAILNDIQFVQKIDQIVPWDRKQWNVSPGNLAKAFILATFYDVRAPLSRISERYVDVDTEFLFGKGVFPEHLNDDAIGNALDKIGKIDLEKAFMDLCVTSHDVYKIAFKRLHSDTTSVSFYGDYETDQEYTSDLDLPDEELLQIVKGYNKDNRIGCNQAVVGKIVNEHGVPVACSVMDGNTSDVVWNDKAIGFMRNMIGEQMQNQIYIADSKLITKNLYLTMMSPDQRISFISRCPANFNNKLAESVTQRAYLEGHWQDIGAISERKDAAHYQAQEFSVDVYGYTVRLLVYQTSEGTERFERKAAQQLAGLEKAISDVEKKEFLCEADVRKELERFQKEHKNSIYSYSASIVTKEIKKRPRGNPGKNPKPPKIITIWSLNIEIIGPNDALMDKLQRKEESFVLITNTEQNELSPAEVLKEYKNQSKVEIQFRLLKDPSIASTIFLKKAIRIRAMVILLGVALLIRALLQYRARRGYQDCTKPLPKVGWNGAKLKGNITAFFIMVALENHEFIREKPGEYSYTFVNSFSQERIMTIFELMGITVEDLIN